LSIQRWQFFDLVLIYAYSGIRIEASDRGLLSFAWAYSLGLMAFERIPEGVVVLQRYYRLREIVEVASQDIGSVMYSIAGPIQTFPIAGWGVKGSPELFDALLRAC
jgi:hypothetical protein